MASTRQNSSSVDASVEVSTESPFGSEAKRSGTKKSHWLVARRSVQMASIVLFALPLLLSGWALFGWTPAGDEAVSVPADLPFFGSLSSSSIAGLNVLDPFAALQIQVAAKEPMLDLLLFALPVLIVYGLIRGRAFCGWVCPVNFILEGVDFLRVKLGIQVKEKVVPRRAKIFVALGVLLISALISVPIFEAFSPISFINKGILFGSITGLVAFLAIILIELFWGHRVWCRALCPTGGFYEVLGRVGVFNVHFDKNACTHCNKCKERCLADPEILDPILTNKARVVKAGDCMICGACVDVCPTHALSIKPGR